MFLFSFFGLFVYNSNGFVNTVRSKNKINVAILPTCITMLSVLDFFISVTNNAARWKTKTNTENELKKIRYLYLHTSPIYNKFDRQKMISVSIVFDTWSLMAPCVSS